MRFDYLNLRAFGHFTDYEISFDPSKNFHLLYGPNEAGKSTTLRSITDFLFGFPQKTNDSFLHNNSKLRIEGQVKNSKGEVLQFIRRKGRKDTVLDLDGNSIDEKLVQDIIQGMPQSQFTSMFALDHVRLREGGESLLQSSGSAGESVFSAASGINLLRNILEKFDKEAGNLYKKTGSIPTLNKLLAKEKELTNQLQQYQLKIKEWKELERDYLEKGNQILELKQEIKALHTQQEKLERVKRMLPKLAKQKDLLQKIQDLGNVPDLPDEIKDIRILAENQLHGSNKDIDKIDNELKEIEAQLQKISIPTKVLDQKSTIDSLYREVQSYQNHVNQLPEINGKKKQLEVQVVSIMKEIDTVHATIDNMDKYRISVAIKETIRELAKQKPLLNEKLVRMDSESSKLEKELEKKQDELSSLPELPNMEQLEDIIDRVKREGLEQSLISLKLELRDKEQLLNEGIRQLYGWNGTYEELLNLQVPTLQETIKKYEKERTEIQQQLQKNQEQITQQVEAIEGYQEKIRQMDSLVEIPSIDDLHRIRSSRDDGWKLIRMKLQTGNWNEKLAVDYTNGQAIEDVYEDFVRDADQKADTMRVEAENVSLKSRLKSDIESGQKKVIELEKIQQDILKKVEAWETNWLELWKPAQIIPLSPEEMKEWLQKFHQLKTFASEWLKLSTEKEKVETEYKESKQILFSILSAFSKVTHEQSLDELLNIADKQFKQMREIENKKLRLEQSILETKEKMKQDKIEKLDILQKLDTWNNEWDEVISQTNLPVNISTMVAEKLLEKYEQCSSTYEQFKAVEEEKIQIQKQILSFEERVEQVLELVGNTVDGSNVEPAVSGLYSLLQKGKEDQLHETNLLNQQKGLQSNRKEAVERLTESEQILKDLYKSAKCETIEELREIERSFLLKKEYQTSLSHVEADMLEQGNGKSLREIAEEANVFASDNIEVEIEEMVREREELDNELNQVNQDYGIIKKEYQEKIKGNNSASILAQQEKESIHAQIASLTDQYIQFKLASTLLQKGIEYYRNQNQNPILRRASEIFARLTLQSFVGLSVDYDEKDQPILMGIRENDEKVAIEGMSDGTTDQLYLSLRIASIEKYVDENEPIPFIVDDILVHFDDTRSKETLSILLELSKHTQIIFFTHHARLIEILNEVSEEKHYQLLKLNQNEMVFTN